MLNKIWEWAKSIDKKVIIISLIEALLFIFVIISISQCSNQKIKNLDQNFIASRDKINELTLENGNLLAERSAYIVKNNELEEILNITKQEKKDIERKLNDKIAYISTIESNIRVDTLELVNTVIIKDSSTINIRFNYDDKWVKFSGSSYYKNDKSKTTIFDINVNTPLKVGLTNDLTIFVESENPYLNITNIEGAVIDGSTLHPKKKRWNLSLHGGVGVHYGLFSQKVDVGPYVGAGISYNF